MSSSDTISTPLASCVLSLAHCTTVDADSASRSTRLVWMNEALRALAALTLAAINASRASSQSDSHSCTCHGGKNWTSVVLNGHNAYSYSCLSKVPQPGFIGLAWETVLPGSDVPKSWSANNVVFTLIPQNFSGHPPLN
eukprot:gene8399-20630_t